MGEVGASVVDVTPIDHYSFDRPRGEEIQQWLDANPTGSFIILDDEVDMAGLESRLVRTHVETGLTEEDADRAIRMFLNT